MADNPYALFRTEPFTVTVDGREYVFPHLPADRWMAMLAHRDWITPVFHLIDEEAYTAFLDRAEAGGASVDDLKRIGFAVLTEAAGRPWWEAVRLAGSCNANLGLAGTVLARGIDPSRMSIAAFLAVVWSAIMQGRDATQRAQVEMELSLPPEDAMGDMPEPDVNELVARMRAAPGVSIG